MGSTKLLPDKKLFLVSYAIAFLINVGGVTRIDGPAKLVAWLLVDNLIYAILVMVVLRIAIWIGKKAGLVK